MKRPVQRILKLLLHLSLPLFHVPDYAKHPFLDWQSTSDLLLMMCMSGWFVAYMLALITALLLTVMPSDCVAMAAGTSMKDSAPWGSLPLLTKACFTTYASPTLYAFLPGPSRLPGGEATVSAQTESKIMTVHYSFSLIWLPDNNNGSGSVMSSSAASGMTNAAFTPAAWLPRNITELSSRTASFADVVPLLQHARTGKLLSTLQLASHAVVLILVVMYLSTKPCSELPVWLTGWCRDGVSGQLLIYC